MQNHSQSKLYGVILAIIFVGACKAPNSASLKQEVAATSAAEPGAAKILLVLNGGFNSCGSEVVQAQVPAHNDLPTSENRDFAVAASGQEPTRLKPGFALTGAAADDATALRLTPLKSSLYYHAVRTCVPSELNNESTPFRCPPPSLEETAIEGGKRQGLRMSWVASCYGMDANTVHYVDSESPEKNINVGTRAALWQHIAKLARDADRVLVLGHSYGGWTAMQLLLSGVQLNKVKALATVDPISVVDCTPGAYMKSSPGCQKFPADITAEQRRAVAKIAGNWRNFWQDVTKGGFLSSPLHSGPAQVAGVEDVKLQLNHTQIDDARDVWLWFKNQIPIN